jgi:hypothetical protein
MAAEQSYKEIIEEYHAHILSPRHPTSRRIRRIVERILEANELGHLQGVENCSNHGGGWWGAMPEHVKSSVSDATKWTLTVVDDPKTVNAAAAFGNIIVFTGILQVCKDDESLAAVLGHEIGHAKARHASERISLSLPIVLLRVFLLAAGVDFFFTGPISRLFVELPGSRAQEREADKIGLALMAKACYDPRGAVEMQTKLSQIAKSPRALQILSTHPAGEDRVKSLTKLLPKAYEMRSSSPGCSSELSRSATSFRAVLGIGTDAGQGVDGRIGTGFGWDVGSDGGREPEVDDRAEPAPVPVRPPTPAPVEVGIIEGAGQAEGEILKDKW